MEQENDTFVDFIIADRRDALHFAPVVHELLRDSSLCPRVTVVTSGNDSLTSVLASLDISPDIQWKIRGSENNQSLFHAEVLLLLGEFWGTRKPKWLLSFGYSEFTFAYVFSAFQNDIQIAHLVDTKGMDESPSAGRQGQHKQRLISSMSSIHFTPNIHCKNLLLADGIDERKIFSVGSPLLESGKIISESDFFTSRIIDCSQVSQKIAKLSGGSFVLIELDNSQPQHEQFIDEIRRIVLTNSLVRFVFLDLKCGKKDTFTEIFSPYNLMTIDHIGHMERCFLQANALFTLSDSVEVLEECAGFGTRGILLQSSTVRLDLVSSGWITLASPVGEDLDKKFQTLLGEGKTIQAQLPQKPAEATTSGASRRIVAALTSRTNENEQRWRTSLPL